MGVAIGHGVELGVGDALALEAHGRALRPLVHRRFPIVADEVVGIRIDGLHAVHGPQDALQKTQLARDARHQAHGVVLHRVVSGLQN
jgi:hypothetical protein